MTRKQQEISQLLSDRSEQARLQGIELRTGQRPRHLHQRLVSRPCSWSAMHFPSHSYCIVSPFIYIFVAPTGSKVIIKVSQPFLCASQMIKKYAYHHSLSLKEALLCWRADDKESSGQTPINLIICGEGRQQGMKPFWWQIAHRLRHWINSLENSRMLPLYRNPHCI